MKSTIQNMLEQYQPANDDDYRNALKEIVQEIALSGLSRTNFFREAAFYGGTALRIFHGLARFSEDMDFSLLAPDAQFTLTDYFRAIEQELSAYGLRMTISQKNKLHPTAIQSAFIKGGTLIQIISIEQREDLHISGISPQEQVKIKIEIDTNPPVGADYEFHYALRPRPFAVRLYDRPSLFAGKIHAVLCRNWQHRVKGRDLYDYVWYLSDQTPVNLFHLQKRLEQSGQWQEEEALTLDSVKELLMRRFEVIDFRAAREDVLPFIKDSSELELWGKDFFQTITQELQGENMLPAQKERKKAK